MLTRNAVVGFALLLFGLILAVYGMSDPGGEPGFAGLIVGTVGVIAVLVGSFSSR